MVDGLPLFPTTAPEAFRQPAATRALFAPVLSQLAAVVAVPADLAMALDESLVHGWDLAVATVRPVGAGRPGA